jgi:hypothetical protein
MRLSRTVFASITCIAAWIPISSDPGWAGQVATEECTQGAQKCDPDNEPRGICICRRAEGEPNYWACGRYGTKCEVGTVCVDNGDGTVDCIEPSEN